jgi:hypothetical protein
VSVTNPLVSAALVGVERVGLPPVESLPEPLQALAAGLADRPPEALLLLLAGALDRYTEAGRLPERATRGEWHLPAFQPGAEPAPVPETAARFYDDVLNQRHTDLLPELLDLTARAGKRVPDRQLPHLLEHGAKVARQRPAIWPVVGERGRWLASLNPKWRYATAHVDDPGALRAVWQDDPDGRAALLAYVRPRDPRLARRLVELVWPKSSDAERRELVRGLEPGLSAADEPFLERALDDRDTQVRRKTIDLLAALPGSRLSGRMTEAAGGVLVLRGGTLWPRFEMGISDSLVRDGVIRPAGSAPTVQERSRQIIQMVGAIPLGHWVAALRQAPEALIRAALAGKWPRTLLSAFASATIRQRDAAWAEALLDLDEGAGRSAVVLVVLSPERANERLEAALAAGDGPAVLAYLRHWPGGWDEVRGRLLLEYLAAQARHDPEGPQSAMLRHHARLLGQRLPPGLAADAAELFQGTAASRAWEASLRQVQTMLETRRAMHRALGIA